MDIASAVRALRAQLLDTLRPVLAPLEAYALIDFPNYPNVGDSAIYLGQLALNAIWTPIFFALYPTIGVAALWIALAVILALDVAVPLTILAFRPISRLAAILLVPYWLWILFATTLNWAAATLN